MFPISSKKQRNENNGWNCTTIYCGFETRENLYIVIHLERDSFSFGAAEKKEEGYFITEDCIGCGSCLNACPQNCIESGSIPHVIEQEHCLHCGNCMNVCPAGAVVRR